MRRSETTHGEQHVSLILVYCFEIRNSVDAFGHAHTFAGEDSLIDTERARRDGQNPAVRWNFVADSDSDDISRNEFRRVYLEDVTVPENFGFVWGVLTQGLW